MTGGCHSVAPHFQVFSASQRVVGVLPICGFVPPHWHFEGYGLQSLTLHPVGCCLQLLASLAVYRLLSGFFRGLRGFPYLLAAPVRSGFATSLRPGPWLIVSSELAPVLRFGSAAELCSRLFRALPVARFHPCSVSALSPDLLSPFEVSGFWCPARPCGLPFPLRSFYCPGVSLHL